MRYGENGLIFSMFGFSMPSHIKEGNMEKPARLTPDPNLLPIPDKS